MSELKTLDDFEDVPCEDFAPHSCGGRKLLKEELRESAKEWVLDLQESIGDDLGDYADVWEAQIKWIKHFFNLEDEDK